MDSEDIGNFKTVAACMSDNIHRLFRIHREILYPDVLRPEAPILSMCSEELGIMIELGDLDSHVLSLRLK